MNRSATAQWNGGIKNGQGMISTESGALSNLPYSFAKRFGDEKGTNPEELIGAAHAGCFAMAFSGELEKRNFSPESIDVKASVSVMKDGEGFTINKINLDVTASVPNADQREVEAAARSAKENCPVSKLFNAEISMNFHMSSQDSAALQ